MLSALRLDHPLGLPKTRAAFNPARLQRRIRWRMAGAQEAQSSTDRTARQGLRSAVNFGVASLARVLGMPPSALLELRCECGCAACAARVRISLRDYQDAGLDRALLVVQEHAQPTSSPLTAHRRWAVVDGEAGGQSDR
jgi:hypothetical protein